MGYFSNLVLSSQRRLVVPILTFPGARLIGASVRDLVTNAAKQVEAQQAIHLKYGTPVWLSAMDLSVEAEEFGCDIHFAEDEIPTVIGRRVTSREEIEALTVPNVGSKRSPVYLETVHQLSRLPECPLALGGMIGPFSLAGRLFGLSEIMMLTAVEPETVHLLLEKITAYLLSYAKAQQSAGAQGIIMAEPSAGLLSPKSLSVFSASYIHTIVDATRSDTFEMILHNCAAQVGHLTELLKIGAKVYHFGAPMDLVAALAKVPRETVICGNLDPARVFCEATPDQMAALAGELLEKTRDYPNFVLSSGCDVPASSPAPVLEAFFKTVEQFSSY
jgi:uroporphyrinogen decarboxylase